MIKGSQCSSTPLRNLIKKSEEKNGTSQPLYFPRLNKRNEVQSRCPKEQAADDKRLHANASSDELIIDTDTLLRRVHEEQPIARGRYMFAIATQSANLSQPSTRCFRFLACSAACRRSRCLRCAISSSSSYCTPR